MGNFRNFFGGAANGDRFANAGFSNVGAGSSGQDGEGGDGFFKRMMQAYAVGPAGMLEIQDQKKKMIQQGKIADQIVRSEPEFLKQMGMDEDTFHLMAPQEKSARVQGVIEGIGAKKALAQLKQEMDQQAARQRFQAALSSAASDEGTGTGGFEFAGADTPRPSPLRPKSRMESMTGDEMLKLGLQSGMAPEDVARLGPVARQMRPRFEPGTLKDLPGLPDYKYLIQSPEGAGSAVPIKRSTKTEKVKAPAGEAWIYSDDVDEFKRNLDQVKDPAMRDAIMASRRQFNLSTGKMSDQEERAMWVMNGGSLSDYYKFKAAKTGKGPAAAVAGAGSKLSYEDFQSWKKGRK